MRAIAVLLFLLPWLTSGAEGQVSVDMRALDPGGTADAPRPVVPKAGTSRQRAAGNDEDRPEPRPRVVRRPVAAVPPATPVVTPVVKPAEPSPPLAALPTTQPAAPPPSATVSAPTPSPAPLPPPVRLLFETGQTELSAANENAIRDLARSMPEPAGDSVDVVAYAAGQTNDASTARRLSLSRGLAVRSVLLASGVPSAQIYVRALGATFHEGPPDRVELTVTPIGTVAR
jgi:outer membrane protein OmpA-like peptidoglycan-associated protein